MMTKIALLDHVRLERTSRLYRQFVHRKCHHNQLTKLELVRYADVFRTSR